MALIHVRSINRPTATKVSEFTDPNSGLKLGKTKIGRATDRRCALWDDKVGGLANGLSYKPWLDDNGQPVKDGNGTPLTLQDKMEQKWNLPKGFLTNKVSKKGDYKASEATYYQETFWILNDGTTVLDTSKMHDELGYYVFLDSKYVANSEREWREHKWPHALWFIAQANEEEELKANKLMKKTKALGALADDQLPISYKEKFVHILNLANAFTPLTDASVFNLLHTYIDSSDYLPNSNLDKFTVLYEASKTAVGKEYIEARHLLKRALDARVVYERQGTYNWTRPDGNIRLGENYAEAVDYILDPKKVTMVEDLEREITLKTNK